MILQRDQTFRVVFNLRTPVLNGESVGTGIFVAKNNNNLYMVTATHVATTCNGSTKVVISDEQGNSTELRLTQFNQNLSWKHHPKADISILPVQMTIENQNHLQNRFFPYGQIHTDKTVVSRDFELTSVGFPNGLGAFGRFSPLTYRSYASSSFITLNRADTNTPCDFFLLENPSVGGYSGCPIFDLGYINTGTMMLTKEKTVCYGIMHGTISDNTGGKLSAVTPCFYLADII